MISVFIEHIQADLAALEARARALWPEPCVFVSATIRPDEVAVHVHATNGLRIDALGATIEDCIETCGQELSRRESARALSAAARAVGIDPGPAEVRS